MKDLILVWIISTSHMIAININEDSKLSIKTIESSKCITNDVKIGRWGTGFLLTDYCKNERI